MAVKLVEKAAESLVGRFERCEGAARADVEEARALEWYLCYAKCQQAALPMERSLYTFLLMLRLGSGEDVPAPKPLRDFSRRFFNMDSLSEPVFSGVDEEEDLWEPLEQLWREFNKGKICPRSSELRWRMNMGRPRQPARRPPPLLFESYDDEEDSRRPCGWNCGGECVQLRTGGCQGMIRGFWRPSGYMRLNEPRKLNPECSCSSMGSLSGCWNIFDLVDRLVYEDQFVTLPVHNLGWNLRKALQRQEVIDEAYLKASKVHLPEYWALDEPDMHPLRVREARRLIQGLKCSPFLRKLLLMGKPQSMLPLHFSLADAAAHARLWLLRSDLPVYLEHRSFTYAVICTASERPHQQVASDMPIKERVPSILELELRSNTLELFWQPRARNGLTGLRVGNMRAEDYKVPEPLLRANESLWEALIELPHPIVVCAEGADPAIDVVRNYGRLLLVAERRKTRRLLFPHGEPKLEDFHDFENAVIQAARDDQKKVGETLVHWQESESPALIQGSPVAFPSSHYLSITGGQIQAPVPPVRFRVLVPVPVPVPVPAQVQVPVYSALDNRGHVAEEDSLAIKAGARRGEARLNSPKRAKLQRRRPSEAKVSISI